MEKYPRYGFDDFYTKHYYEGGLHLFQVQLMYEHVVHEENARYSFFAALQGVDLDKALNKEEAGERTKKDSLDKQEKAQDLPIFRDPSEYENLSEEEREELTKEMMQKHKMWATGKQSNVGGK